MDIIKIFDIISGVGTVICLNLVARYSKAWLFYSGTTILFIIVCHNRNLPGLTFMGIVLFFTGLKNYWVSRGQRNGK
ncbi:hypothetical protein DRN69_05235 [Candidatus Pacearchaeota archaeon]|nr:MAG: hypothetical protein DRN69_05235 [Candidatus Pacearchaeota archaeon]